MKRSNFLIFKYLNFFIVAAAMLLTLSGCIEEYEAVLSDDDTDLLVVEGTIHPGENTFILSRTQPVNSTDIYPMIRRAEISVRGSDGSEYVTQSDYGYHTCWIDALAPDVAYYLHIEVDGEVYESDPQKPLRTEGIADVRGVQNTPESNIDVLITPDAPFQPDKANYYSWTYDETWEVRPEYTTRIYFDIETMKVVDKPDQFPKCGWKDATIRTIMVGASLNYEGQHIQQLKAYDIDRGDERMFHKYSGLVHQRAISKAEYEYELARRQAGSEMGGLFTPLPSALPTNIRCLTSSKHVIGFVGCSLNTTERRFFLDADDFSILYPPKEDHRTWFDNTSDADCRQMVYEGKYLCVWEDKRMIPGGRLRTAWAPEPFLDVRYKGAYIERPVFWPEEEEEEEEEKEEE